MWMPDDIIVLSRDSDLPGAALQSAACLKAMPPRRDLGEDFC